MSAAIPRLEAGPDTVHWGYFSADLAPVLTVDSGARVVMSSVPALRSTCRRPLSRSRRRCRRSTRRTKASASSAHMCTGPVAVRGAKAGQVLPGRHRGHRTALDWGYTLIRPTAGALPDEFPDYRIFHVAIDKARMVGRMPWGAEIPLRPFFGVMAVAPPASWGTINTPPPRPNGGNMDLKELVAGATLYLPIFTRRRAVLGRRRPRRAGRRRGLHHRHRDRAHRHVPLERARGHEPANGRARRRRRTSSPWASIPISTNAPRSRCGK